MGRIHSQNEHAIAIAEESVLCRDCLAIAIQHQISSRECAYEHEQSGAGQMEVCQQSTERAKLESGINEQVAES
jgi:hypothetical protein